MVTPRPQEGRRRTAVKVQAYRAATSAAMLVVLIETLGAGRKW